MNYYNEIDPYCIHWLDNLIDAGVIPKGVIDTRPIEEIDPYEIRGFTQYHFFAGLGGWSEALRLAGWPEDQPIITGSCPCQPFSCAGKGQGETDPRHLWPFFYKHIAELGIPVVVGEQVASNDGREWLDALRIDLERTGYVVGCADLPAAGVAAPHIRSRLFWMANTDNGGRQQYAPNTGRHGTLDQSSKQIQQSSVDCVHGRMANSDSSSGRNNKAGESESMDGERRSVDIGLGSIASGLGDASSTETERLRSISIPLESEQETGRSSNAIDWQGVKFIECSDGKARPVKPGICPLAHGIPGRVGQLRAYGNAIVPQVAAQFVRSAVQAR